MKTIFVGTKNETFFAYVRALLCDVCEVTREAEEASSAIIDMDTAPEEPHLPTLAVSFESALVEGRRGMLRPFDAEAFCTAVKDLLAETTSDRALLPEADLSAVRVLTADGTYHRITLTETEARLLAVLAGNEGAPVAREALERAVWGESCDTGRLEVYIHYLRNKLEGPAGRKLIHTVRGHGYALRD